MKPVKHTILLLIIYAVFVMLWSFLMYGCSAERLHQKAINKGYMHALHVDTIKVARIDTIYKNGIPQTIIAYKDSFIYSIQTEYLPKWRYRFDNNRFADSLAQIRAMYEAKLKNELKRQKIKSNETKIVEKQKTKQTRSDNKNTFADAMKWLFLSLLLVALFLIIRAIKRYITING